MNKNLAYFSIFLILIGIGFGIYLVLFLGVLLLIPALLSSARFPTRSPPTPSQSPRRITPTAPAQPTVPSSEQQPMATPAMYGTPMYSPTQYQGYSGSLFPGTMFPSLSQVGPPPTATSQPPPSGQERDGLLEIGAILAVLKLLSG
ncbi:MAG: hypothetical protein JRN06_08685 [Nitrososphaerota archaeon]|nr:hypothetical protein [Nitrososphaerota archaeon]MDG7024614.1 hypothetical protein [Nitrososphaerota archaeon]